MSQDVRTVVFSPEKIDQATTAFAKEKEHRGKMRKRKHHEIESLRSEYQLNQPRLPNTHFDEKTAYYRTSVKVGLQTYKMYSYSLDDAIVASRLAKQVSQNWFRGIPKLYQELLQTFDENQELGLPGDTVWSPPNTADLGFTQITVAEQQDALKQLQLLHPHKPYVHRNMAQRFAGDLCKCRRCTKVFRWDTKNGHKKRPAQTACAVCVRAEHRRLKQTSWYYRVNGMIRSTITSSQCRQGKRQRDGTRRVMAASQATVDQCRLKLEALQFRCWYTRVLPHGGLWLHKETISPERINEELTYLENNWQPIHIAFQSALNQWTHEKVLAVPELRNLPSLSPEQKDFEDAFEWSVYIATIRAHNASKFTQVYSQSIPTVITNTVKRIRVRKLDENTWIVYVNATKAEEALGVSHTYIGRKCRLKAPKNQIKGYEVQFDMPIDDGLPILHESMDAAAKHVNGSSPGVSEVCNDNRPSYRNYRFWYAYAGERRRDDATMPYLYRYARNLWNSARSSTLQRNEKRTARSQPPLPEVSITEHDILLLMQKQKRRCAYLDVPLSFESGADWQASLERIDRDVGYSLSNCILVCGEVNTSYFQWSQEFAERVWPR